MESPSDRDRTDAVGRGGDSGYLDDWIETIAQSEELEPTEVVERLVSSYWTVKEMSAIIGDAEGPFGGDTGKGVEWSPESYQEALEAIDARVDQLEAVDHEAARRVGADLATLRQELRESVAELSEEVADVESELADVESELAEEVGDVEAALSDRQASIESRLDEELEHLADILEYLVERTDVLDIDGRAVEGLRRFRLDLEAERGRLRALLARADRLGATGATCEGCGEGVDLRLLTTPACPHCERPFAGLEHEERWFGRGSTTLTVEEEPSARRDSPASREPRTEAATDRDADESAPVSGFRWGEHRE